MDIFRFVCFILLWISITASSCGYAQTVFELRGIALGDTRTQVLEKWPEAQCYVYFDGKEAKQEICDLKTRDALANPILQMTDSKVAIHFGNGMLFAVSILVPTTFMPVVVLRLEMQIGKPIEVPSLTARKMNKESIAFMWDHGANRLIADLEASAANENFLMLIQRPIN